MWKKSVKKVYLEKNSEKKCEKSVPGKKIVKHIVKKKCEKSVPGKRGVKINSEKSVPGKRIVKQIVKKVYLENQ